MSLLPERESWFQPRNFVPESKLKPVCPNFQIIEICAQLSNYKIDNQRFCGTETKNLHTVSYETTCMKVRNKLAKMLSLASKKIDTPNKEKLEKINKLFLDKSINPLEKISKTSEYTKGAEDLQEQSKIISRWQKQIWELTCVNTKSKDNHFRQFEKPEDLPTEEVLTKVGFFLDALKNITDHSGGPNMIDASIDYNPYETPANCPQAPDRL